MAAYFAEKKQSGVLFRKRVPQVVACHQIKCSGILLFKIKWKCSLAHCVLYLELTNFFIKIGFWDTNFFDEKSVKRCFPLLTRQ